MSSVRKKSHAIRDLDEIWHHIAHDNVKRADSFIRKLDERFRLLARHPAMGRLRDELSPELRNFTVGQYVIFYRSVKNGVDIIRVLHSARDIGSSFFDDDDAPVSG